MIIKLNLMIKRFYYFLSFLCAFTFLNTLNAQTLTCNNHINVGVNYACSIDLTIDMFLEADVGNNEDITDPAYTFVIYDLAGDPIIYGDYTGPTLILGLVLDANLLFEVYYNNLNLCWGTVLFEDKIAPEIQCDCPVGGEDLNGDGIKEYSEDCTLVCYELPILKERYWDRLRDELIPEDVEDFVDDNTEDNCDGVTDDNISYYDVFQDLGCNGTLMRRTWTLTYYTGTGSTATKSCTREYYFKPFGLETLDTARIDAHTGQIVVAEDSFILPFHVVTLTCGTDITPYAISMFYDDPATQDQDTDDNNVDPDELDIDRIIENNEGIPYAYPHYYVNGRNPSGPHAQPINTEVCNIIVGYTDQDIEACQPGCYGNSKVLRTWTILDWCIGEYIEYGQIIKVIDNEGPTIDVRDISVSVDAWKCEADVKLRHPEHLNDYCDNYITYWIGSVTGALEITGNADDGYIMHNAAEGQTFRVEYVTEDCCGNRGNTYIDVTVKDFTPPVPVTKEFIVTSLTNIGNPIDGQQGIAKVYAEDVDNGSYDGCTAVSLAVRRTDGYCPGLDTLWGPFVGFCCEDLNGQISRSIDVQFRVTDAYGNVNYAWSEILLEDKSNSTQSCPLDLVLTCEMDYNNFSVTGLPGSFSACGELDLGCDFDELIEDTEPRRKGPNDGFFGDPRYDGQEVPAYDPSCGFGAIRRQFKSCSSCTQWFVIEPINPFNPASIGFPADIIVDCDGFDRGEPDWNPATCNLIGVSLTSDTFNFEDGACYKILNHWSIIDWCSYNPTNPNSPGKWDHTQLIKIIDTQDPELTVVDSLCFAADQDCSSTGIQLSARAADSGVCKSEWLKWDVTIDLNSDWTSDYFYGTSLPRITNGSPNPYYMYPSGNDELVTISLPDGIPTGKIWHRAVWRVYDGCGNNVSHVRYFQVSDKKAPTPYFLNLSTAVMSGSGQVELWAVDFNVGSFDNCTSNENILFTFSDVAPPARNDSEYDSSSDLQWYNGTFWYYDPVTGDYQDQDDYFDGDAHRWEPGLRSAGKIFTIDDADPDGFARIPIYAWDECGNKDYSIVNLRLVDNMGVGEGRIAGQIMTETGAEVEGVMTQLMSDDPDFPVYNMTNFNGEYAFESAPYYNDYTVSGSKNDDLLNGVSTLDLLLIQKHVLGQQMLDSPYKMIAADVNNDKDVTAIDLIELRKLVLGVYTELPNNESWKVIDAAQVLTISNVWSYEEYISIQDLQEDMTSGDFVGVKIGDVNSSAEAHLTNNPVNDLKSVVSLEYDDRYVTEGEIIELQLTSGQEAIYGFQFTLDMNAFELVELNGKNINNSNVAVFDNSLTMSYHELTPIDVDDHIVSFVMKAKKDGQISDLIDVNSDITKAEAYVGESLSIVDINLSKVDNLNAFELYQNQPNPFNEYTIVGFNMDKGDDVRLSLFDITGRIIKVFSANANAGYNEIKIAKSDLSTNGMIYYTLETSEHTATKHMIVIE